MPQNPLGVVYLKNPSGALQPALSDGSGNLKAVINGGTVTVSTAAASSALAVSGSATLLATGATSLTCCP